MEFDITQMLQAEVYDHQVRQLQLIETHISWVILTGDFAYKIKKPVDFGFLDFSTLEKRHLACLQELQLNRRTAPELYLDVVSITGDQDKLALSGRGRVLESAVKMAQFPQSAQLDNMLLAGELNVAQVEAIAEMVANFHQAIKIAGQEEDFGTADEIYKPVEENFRQIAEHLEINQYAATLGEIRAWSRSRFEVLTATLEQRKKLGFIRECHGDLHLRNLVWLNDKPLAFDCIEFNPQLRWIDVISDIAFLVMDLHRRDQRPLATRFLNSYLEITGDYAGLTVLPFYLCYRALVRAKVDALRLEQAEIPAAERVRSRREFEAYLELAGDYSREASPKLIIMCGMSASGKSSVSVQLADELGAVRIRSDVERKRLFKADKTSLTAAEFGAGIYKPGATQQTYQKLAQLAVGLLSAGYSVIVDAAFLHYQQRQHFKNLASGAGVPFVILETTAADKVLRQRIVNRQNDVSDADLAVLEQQIKQREAVRDEERVSLLSVDTERAVVIKNIINKINKIGVIS